MPTKKKIATPEVIMPSSREEAERLVQLMATLQGKVVNIETKLNDKVNELQTAAAQEVAPTNEEIVLAFKQVQLYATANRDVLVKGAQRSVKFGAGVVGWRTNPRKCSVSGVEAVIESLERLGFTEAVRSKKEVAKDVILNDWEKYRDVKGLKFSKVTNFFVTPNETQLERAEVVK